MSAPPQLTDTASIVIPIVVPAVVLLATVVLYAVLRRKAPKADNEIVFTVVFGLLNLATNAWFVLTLWLNTSADTLPDALKYVALVSFGLTIVINVTTASVLLRRLAGKSDATNAWFRQHYGTAAMAVVVSASHLTSLQVLSSRILRMDAFSAALDTHDEQVIMAVQVATFFTGDIPMVALQAYVVVSSSLGVNTVAQTIAYISLIMSVVSLLLSGTQRLFFWVGHRHQRRLEREAVLKSYVSDLTEQTARTAAAAASIEMGEYPASSGALPPPPPPPSSAWTLAPPPPPVLPVIPALPPPPAKPIEAGGWMNTSAYQSGNWAPWLAPAPSQTVPLPDVAKEGRAGRKLDPVSAWAEALSGLHVATEPENPISDDDGVDAEEEEEEGEEEQMTPTNDVAARAAPTAGEDATSVLPSAPFVERHPANMRAVQGADKVAATATALARKMERDKAFLEQRLRQLDAGAAGGAAPAQAAPAAPPAAPAEPQVVVSAASVRQVVAAAAITSGVAKQAELDRKLLEQRIRALEAGQKVSITVRRYGETRGGRMVEVKDSLPALMATVNAALGGQFVALREATHLAEVVDTSLMKEGMLLYATTAQDEREHFGGR